MSHSTFFFPKCLGSPVSTARSLLACALLSLPLSPHLIQADEVYRWEGPDGVVHYSNTPQDDHARPAELPRITRGRLSLEAKAMETCQNHGDINCQAGADVDGSVICTDGFLDASTRYRFFCNSPKLEVADIGKANASGDFSILVRNAKSVAAQKPELILRLNQMTAGVILKGPDKIDPFDTAEFIYKASEYGALSKKLENSQITIACANCDN